MQDNDNFQSPDFNSDATNGAENIQNPSSEDNYANSNNLNEANQNNLNQGNLGQAASTNQSNVQPNGYSGMTVTNNATEPIQAQNYQNQNVTQTPEYKKQQAEFTYNGSVSSESSNNSTDDPAKEDKPGFFKRIFSSSKDKSTETNKDQISIWVRIRNISLLVLILLVAFLAIWGIVDIVNTISAWQNPMSTPQKTVSHMLELVEKDDLESFESLLDTANIANPQILFSQLKSATADSAGSINSNYILIRLENGRQLLVSLYYNDDSDEHRIRSVVEIPAEAQGYFSN